MALPGRLVGGVLARETGGVGPTGAGACLIGGVHFNLASSRSVRKAGSFLQSGYQITNRYEIVPDSIDQGPHLRIVPVK